MLSVWIIDCFEKLYFHCILGSTPKIYEADEYCLDHTFNFCDGQPLDFLRAIIFDPDWGHERASTLFGTNKEDSNISSLMKRAGYPTSIFFLLLTLLVFMVIPDLRKVT